jgi:hypothetical protein
MTPYKDTNPTWLTIAINIRRHDGYTIGDYNLYLTNDNMLTLRKTANGNNIVLRLSLNTTPYCCGVMQAGNFYENPPLAINTPDNVLAEMFKIMITLLYYHFRKGILQAWFYKARGTSSYDHSTILRMCKLNGMKTIGKETYNPNSGNKIKGYQMSIVKGKA